MVTKTKPKDFNPTFEVVSCFLEHEGEILLLHRLPHKSQGGKWGAPAGKIDAGETPNQAMIREIWEETGLKLEEQVLQYFRKVFVTYEEISFVYHMFSVNLPEAATIKIKEDEHSSFQWITPEKALQLELVADMDECIKMFYLL